jgi:hypothetical protein
MVIAVMVATPGEIPVILPSMSIAATVVLLDFQNTVLLAGSSGRNST